MTPLRVTRAEAGFGEGVDRTSVWENGMCGRPAKQAIATHPERARLGATLHAVTGMHDRSEMHTQPNAGAERLSSLLAEMEIRLDTLWPDRAGPTAQVRELRSRLLEQRLQIAVLGQFKRGKSTLLNAILGEPVLPTGVVPLTAVPTFIRWGHAIIAHQLHR
jgi:hypothetical protein